MIAVAAYLLAWLGALIGAVALSLQGHPVEGVTLLACWLGVDGWLRSL